MDDQSFKQLKAALDVTPNNMALLLLVVKTHYLREEYEEAAKQIERYPSAHGENSEFCLLAGNVYLNIGTPDRALEFLTSNEAEICLLRAKVLLSLNRLDEGHSAYKAAIEKNAALEDPHLLALLRSNIKEIPSRSGGPKLKVISNDDTNEEDVERLVEPQQERVTFDSVGGLESVKKTIYKKIILPYQKPTLFQRFKKRVGGGILLYGPPGCGKTLLARATAGECNADFFNISISDVLDMYIGESERKLHALFEKARHSSPAVLFFDEVEALGGKRQNTRDGTTSKLVSQFLSEMDGFSQNNHGVLILAATNVPWSVDAAFRRPGRFDRVLFVPPPDQLAREAILKVLLDERPNDGDIDNSLIAKLTSGFSGADLRELVESAADAAIEASIESGEERAINSTHFKTSLQEVRPTTLEWLTTARNYARYSNESGQYDEVLVFLKRHGKK
ncbi:MAG: AAA family ATPase [Candidatus Thiodiazotropha sp. (ex Monitilora ramsayi)]|nr:AAA family ATPase [Candidatus Thiodiazotropha sp. (ex Monitilora ramsayi)]